VRRHPAPAAWVVRTALNAGVSRWRKHRRERPLPAREVALVIDCSEDVDATLLAALRQLPARQREVVVLRVFLDLDTATTADALGVAPGTVTAHLSRAIATMRKALIPVDTALIETRPTTTR
jgi:RNA polymerase sigma-70 factor (ECF subfamily)